MLVMLISFIGISAVNAQSLQEVVYLKNGSVVRGDIVEQVPNESLKIKTADGSLFVYKMEDVAKITKEPYLNSSSKYGEKENDESYGWGRTPRYRGFIGGSYILYPDDMKEDRTYLWTSHGCQINPYLYAGVGVGANYGFNTDLWSVPIFAHVRGELYKVFHKNFSPYVETKIGYSVADCEGFYFAPQIGCHFYFGHSNTGISVGIGYTLQNCKYDDYYWEDNKANADGIEFTSLVSGKNPGGLIMYNDSK